MRINVELWGVTVPMTHWMISQSLHTLQTHPCNENRVFPVYFFSQGKHISITLEPCNENRFSLCWKSTQGKPCSGPVLALYGIAV